MTDVQRDVTEDIAQQLLERDASEGDLIKISDAISTLSRLL